MGYNRLIIVIATVLPIFLLPGAVSVYAHFDHFAHYNGNGGLLGNYYAYQALEPEYVAPGEAAEIKFSIQDLDGNDVENVETMVEVYSAATNERVKVFPWTKYRTGDFSLFYTFPEIGNYQIVLSLSDPGISRDGGIDPPRSLLGNTAGCDCDRAVFNISVSTTFGTIFNATVLGATLAFLIILGLVLGFSYFKRKRDPKHKLSKYEILKYGVMLSAIAGGMVHFAVYSEHASQRLEYSIFLISAGGSQVAYGVLYVLLTLAGQASSAKTGRSIRDYYRNTVLVNLFGLVGTCVLLGLYLYVIILPPPLSPNNEPEAVEFGGILAKSVEGFLVIGIIYLMRWEKKNMQNQLKYIRQNEIGQ